MVTSCFYVVQPNFQQHTDTATPSFHLPLNPINRRYFNVRTAIVIQQTRTWLKTVVIDHTICPFAKREYDRNSIRYCVSDTIDTAECLTSLIEACQHLDTDPDYETTLVILAEGFKDFDDFLTLIDIAEKLLIKQGYEGIYQLASFHPDYSFANAPRNDPANYTNRSPYPMLHILREASIEAILKNHPNPENIPERNIAYTRQLGISAVQKLLADCFKPDAS
ncbi:MAG: DUF1415 domain-containing protein [Methylococcaceae bacterium]|nr:DUF1415 domain-containing protein [Methylococcaceae bacterium]